MNKFFVLFTISAVIYSARAYSGGAPEATCDDMTPKHKTTPQTSPIPYKVVVEPQEIKAGGVVQINVGAKSFKGYQLQVRKGDKAVGKFLIEDDDKFSKPINCHGANGSGATHKNSVEKNNLALKWKAPRTAGKYTVYATVAQDGGVFWTRKPLATITVV